MESREENMREKLAYLHAVYAMSKIKGGRME
jgi:hypothetical protein